MGKVFSFNFDTEEVRELIEKAKHNIYYKCLDCGAEFKHPNEEIKNGSIISTCPVCGSKNIRALMKDWKH
ncbi:hypothetical protein DRN75_02980 [Nanoarchaeota archaeon]|nr:MAG: hypothetical protein DRN75_02980 [Nanoarchaeota archaeon]